ncbi:MULTISPECIES: pyruvate, water dikinase regulatory protein [unclassified Adlercreutzia]|uniref:pyruvate, water dikinase regulatory protein n=1 Tax=unclassified Adlercreutzia TaxID=2636013 RepID=UPI0013EC6DB8|nr:MULTISPECIES: pyruvate, water dikinase regulatory protein [unclassified Adlercreutzia]
MNGFLGEGSSVVKGFPTIHVVSDSVGETARTMAQAAAAQFGVTNPKVEVLGKVTSFEQIRDHLEEHVRYHVEQLGDNKLLVFYTLVHREMRDEVSEWIQGRDNIYGVDLLTAPIEAISQVSGLDPKCSPGALRVADINYFKRVDALEFTIEHDDGRNPQDLTKADMVLLGVSRASKTPLSIYLAQHGYRIANVPLDPNTEPPKEIFDVDKTRLFGLMTSPEVLADIRIRRLGNAKSVASEYADMEYIYNDLEKARELMRRLGCIVVRTDKRAVEEAAQEILSHYLRNHPAPADIMS